MWFYILRNACIAFIYATSYYDSLNIESMRDSTTQKIKVHINSTIVD